MVKTCCALLLLLCGVAAGEEDVVFVCGGVADGNMAECRSKSAVASATVTVGDVDFDVADDAVVIPADSLSGECMIDDDACTVAFALCRPDDQWKLACALPEGFADCEAKPTLSGDPNNLLSLACGTPDENLVFRILPPMRPTDAPATATPETEAPETPLPDTGASGGSSGSDSEGDSESDSEGDSGSDSNEGSDSNSGSESEGDSGSDSNEGPDSSFEEDSEGDSGLDSNEGSEEDSGGSSGEGAGLATPPSLLGGAANSNSNTLMLLVGAILVGVILYVSRDSLRAKCGGGGPEAAADDDDDIEIPECPPDHGSEHIRVIPTDGPADDDDDSDLDMIPSAPAVSSAAKVGTPGSIAKKKGLGLGAKIKRELHKPPPGPAAARLSDDEEWGSWTGETTMASKHD
ncbi:hypothetical protein DIPPA_17220 [Diplonema papillatum]|nr:hypothetical protein DIPPA_17220 [Diplonema papillatum]